MSEIGIEAIRSSSGALLIDSNDLADLGYVDAKFVKERLGFDSRFMLSEAQEVSQLAAQAASDLLHYVNFTPSDSSRMILCVVTQTPDRQIPPLSSEVLAKLDLPPQILAFDLSVGCSGYPLALTVLKSLMLQLERPIGLLVTADGYSRITDVSNRDTAGMFGDGATATMLTADGPFKIGIGDFGTDATAKDALIWRGSGTARETPTHLKMQGRQIMSFIKNHVPESINRCLAQNYTAKSEVDLFAVHQANQFIVSELTRLLEVEEGRIPFVARRTANTTSSSIPLLLEERLFGADMPPMITVLSGFGVGLSWSTLPLYYKS